MAVLHQVLHKLGGLKDRLALVVRAVVFHAIGHMDQRVQSHHVTGAEGGALRAAHGRSGQLVHRLNAQAHVLNGVEQRLDGKHAHAVGDKGRGVLAEHGGLAQTVAAVGHKEVDQRRVAAPVGNDLQQRQVARWIKEVRAAEAGLKVFAPAFGEVANGDATRVRGNGRSGLAVLLHLGKDDLLDVEPLYDDFDDPVAPGDLGHVVFEVARGDALGKSLAIQRAGLGFDAGLEVAIGDGVAGTFFGGKVEQEHVVTGLGEVAGNGAAHHAGAEDGHAVKGVGEGW